MAFHDSKNSRKFLARHFRAIEQRLDVAAQDRQWGAQFVRDVGDEIPSDLIHFPELGDIVEQNERSGNLAGIVPCRHGNELNLWTVQSQFAANWCTAIESIVNEPVECCIPDNLKQRGAF